MPKLWNWFPTPTRFHQPKWKAAPIESLWETPPRLGDFWPQPKNQTGIVLGFVSHNASHRHIARIGETQTLWRESLSGRRRNCGCHLGHWSRICGRFGHHDNVRLALKGEAIGLAIMTELPLVMWCATWRPFNRFANKDGTIGFAASDVRQKWRKSIDCHCSQHPGQLFQFCLRSRSPSFGTHLDTRLYYWRTDILPTEPHLGKSRPWPRCRKSRTTKSRKSKKFGILTIEMKIL